MAVAEVVWVNHVALQPFAAFAPVTVMFVSETCPNVWLPLPAAFVKVYFTYWKPLFGRRLVTEPVCRIVTDTLPPADNEPVPVPVEVKYAAATPAAPIDRKSVV